MSQFKKLLKALIKITPLLKVRCSFLRLAGYHVGKDAYIPTDLLISDKRYRKDNLYIGDRVSFGPRVTLITDSGPNNSVLKHNFPTKSSSIVIEDDAWIGAGTIILPDVKIGKCSIVAAGAVCNKDVEPYTLVGGVPAKLIRRIDKNEL